MTTANVLGSLGSQKTTRISQALRRSQRFRCVSVYACLSLHKLASRIANSWKFGWKAVKDVLGGDFIASFLSKTEVKGWWLGRAEQSWSYLHRNVIIYLCAIRSNWVLVMKCCGGLSIAKLGTIVPDPSQASPVHQRAWLPSTQISRISAGWDPGWIPPARGTCMRHTRMAERSHAARPPTDKRFFQFQRPAVFKVCFKNLQKSPRLSLSFIVYLVLRESAQVG